MPDPIAPPPSPPTAPLISRRAVLAGGAGLVLLAACGGGDDTTASDDTTTTTGSGSGDGPDTTAEGGRVLVAFFDGAASLLPGSPQRTTFGVGDSSGNLVADSPAELTFTVTDIDGATLTEPTLVAAHSKGLPRSYYPVMFTPEKPGNYFVATELDGEQVTAAFAVADEATVRIPGAGKPMPSIATPTVDDAAGVDPICTQDPPCDLHTVTLKDELSAGKAVALLVSTPAYCQTAICGPVLDVFVGARAEFPDITFIHAEVYASDEAVEEQGANAPLAPVMEALSLTYEPSLFLVGADGTIVSRLDVIFDADELREALTTLA